MMMLPVLLAAKLVEIDSVTGNNDSIVSSVLVVVLVALVL